MHRKEVDFYHQLNYLLFQYDFNHPYFQKQHLIIK